MSGLVHYKNGFLIVHDNKRDNQPRISFFKNNNNFYRLFVTIPSTESKFAYLGIERY